MITKSPYLLLSVVLLNLFKRITKDSLPTKGPHDWRVRFWSQLREYEAIAFALEEPPPLVIACIAQGRRTLIELIGDLTNTAKAYATIIDNANRKQKHDSRLTELQDKACFWQMVSDPRTASLEWSAAKDRLRVMKDADEKHRPFGVTQMLHIADLMQSFPHVSLKQLAKAYPPGCAFSVGAAAAQLAQHLPVITISMFTRKPLADHNVHVLSIPGMRSDGGIYFWSLLCLAEKRFHPDGNLDVVDPADEADMDEEDPPENRGRPRLDSANKYGEAIVEFLRQYIYSKGQMNVDSHRLRSSTEVYGAPVRHLAKVAADAGFQTGGG